MVKFTDNLFRGSLERTCELCRLDRIGIPLPKGSLSYLDEARARAGGIFAGLKNLNRSNRIPR